MTARLVAWCTRHHWLVIAAAVVLGQYELLAKGQQRLRWIVPLVLISMLALLFFQFRSLTEASIVLLFPPGRAASAGTSRTRLYVVGSSREPWIEHAGRTAISGALVHRAGRRGVLPALIRSVCARAERVATAAPVPTVPRSRADRCNAARSLAA